MRWLIGGALTSVGLVLVAAHTAPAPVAAAPPWQRSLIERSGDPWPRLLPVAGGMVRIEAPPVRVVAASVLSAEVLLALAPEILVGAHFLAADARFSAAAAAAREFGRSTDGTAEQMLGLRPDLVVTDPFTSAETQALLERARVPVLRMGECRSLDDIRDNLRRIGYGTGLDAAAQRLIDAMDQRLGDLVATANDRAGWRVLSLDGALHTYGRGSIFDDLLRTVGAVNVAAERGAPAFRKLDGEAVLAWRPDALVVGAAPGTEGEELARLRQHPVLAVLPCVQQGRVAFVPHALLASTSHHVAGAAELLARTLAGWGRP